MGKAFHVRFVGAVAIALVVVGAAAPLGAEEASPEETLKRYLTAIQDQKFEDAYEVVSVGMKTDRKTGQVKSKEAWVRESQYVFQFSEAKIFDFKIYPAKVEGEKAIVPNILSSQDRFLNQLGVEEFELYTLVKEDGRWKVDRQEVVVEGADLAKWFPKETAAPPKP